MDRMRVLVSDKLSRDGLQVLEDASGIDVDVRLDLDEDALCACIDTYDGLLIRSGTQVTPRVLGSGSRLKAVGRAGIGVDNIDRKSAAEHGVVIMNTPHGNAVTTAEHALSMLSALCRHIPQASKSMHEGKWEKARFKGRERWKKTLGIVGFGNIGHLVAERSRADSMRVIVHSPDAEEEECAALGVEIVSFADLLAQSDFITVHAPLNDSTRHLFDAEAFGKMKKTALLVNCARGGIVDESALAVALEDGEISGAALDVFEQEPPPADNPLFGRDDVILTPHLGASTHEAQNRVGVEIAEQMIEFLTTGRVRNGVNVPSVSDDAFARLGAEVDLARRLGALVAQLCEDTSELRVTASGPIADLVEPLAGHVLAALASRHEGRELNPLAASAWAEARGLKLTTALDPGDDRPNLRVTVQSSDGLHTATARRSRTGEMRLVGLEGYGIDAILEGAALIVRNADEPGVIGAIGTMLGEHGVNVSRLQVGLDESTGGALSLWSVGGEVSASLAESVRTLLHVTAARSVRI